MYKKAPGVGVVINKATEVPKLHGIVAIILPPKPIALTERGRAANMAIKIKK